MIRLQGVTAVFFLLTSLSYGIVTSDGYGTHIVSPANPTFGGINLSGVAKVNNGSSCTGSAIPNESLGYSILTAAHCLDLSQDVTISFLDGSSVLVNQAHIYRHPGYAENAPGTGYDIGVISLAGVSNLPSVQVYEPYTGSSEVGQDVIVAGWGSTGDGNGAFLSTIHQNLRAGRNQIDGLGLPSLHNLTGPHRGAQNLSMDFDSGLAQNDAHGLLYGVHDLGFLNDEVGFAGGDSGGPTLLIANGQPSVIGVHSYLTSPKVSDLSQTDPFHVNAS